MGWQRGDGLCMDAVGPLLDGAPDCSNIRYQKRYLTGGSEAVMQRKVFRSGPYAELIAQAVQVDNIVYLSGQVGVDANGAAPDSVVAEQTSLAYEHVKSSFGRVRCQPRERG